jgi:hypothetical protein
VGDKKKKQCPLWVEKLFRKAFDAGRKTADLPIGAKKIFEGSHLVIASSSEIITTYTPILSSIL